MPWISGSLPLFTRRSTAPRTGSWSLTRSAYRAEIWLLPSRNVAPQSAKRPTAPHLVDYSVPYRHARPRFTPRQIIQFHYPDPRSTADGLSPLRACFQHGAAERLCHEKSGLREPRLPAAVVSPEGEELQPAQGAVEPEVSARRDSAPVLVGESDLKVQVLSHSMGDMSPRSPICGRPRRTLRTPFMCHYPEERRPWSMFAPPGSADFDSMDRP